MRRSGLTDQLNTVGLGQEIELLVKRNGRPVTVRVKVEDVGVSS
jgi:hypothetical protein